MQFKTSYFETDKFCQVGGKIQFKTPNFQIDKLVYKAEIRPLAAAAAATAQPRRKSRTTYTPPLF